MKRKPAARPGAAQAAAAPRLDANQTRELLRGKRFLAADRAALDVGEIATWDKNLLREHRLLVPIDVQALYVPQGSTEPMLRLPMLVAGPDGKVVDKPEEGMPAPFDVGTPRAAGVHLHWAMPDALLRGRMDEAGAGTANRLGLPALPDRWVVLRLVLPKGGRDALITGWVLEADRAVAVPLGSWREGSANAQATQPAGVALQRTQLTGAAGGAVSWAAVYDAVLNRFALHDPLSDLPTLAPGGVDEDCAAYVVAGWWSDPALDPLDSARNSDSLDELMVRLRWRRMSDRGDETLAMAQRKAEEDLRKALGLTTAARGTTIRAAASAPRSPASPAGAARVAGLDTGGFVPYDKSVIVEDTPSFQSVFAGDASQQYTTQAWQLRASLLHGAIYGVPVKGAPPVDLRPAPGALAVALGHHDDDLLAAFAAGPAGEDQRRATERLLSAFTSQKVNQLASANGLVELEEREHAAAFASLPAGSSGNDRFIQRVQTGRAGGLDLGRPPAYTEEAFDFLNPRLGAPAVRHAHPLASAQARVAAPGGVGSMTVLGFKDKPQLFAASAQTINDLARSRVGDVLAPTEARVVDRPASRFTFASEPLVAIRGASRSLRHGHDGRGSADARLTCRWPSQTIQEISGVIAADRFIRSLGNGSVPAEILGLAREAVLHDPYHDGWIARAVAPPGTSPKVLLTRLQAESVLRFGADGTYDGATAVLHSRLSGTPAVRRRLAAQARVLPGEREQQTLVADELRKFSLYKGADPDLVGVTAWAQPWVPMWLEWEVSAEGLDPASIDTWRLAAIDLEHDGATFDGSTVALRGRALLGSGSAQTLSAAITDWLAAEDKLDAVSAGMVDETTEQRYRELDTAVRDLDIVSASLDGLRTQLLGLAVSDGLRRPVGASGSSANPAPQHDIHALWAGSVRLTRARLLDVFGRTLEVPLTAVITPTRASLSARAGVLAMPLRLLRPSRWLFRLVDAATEVGSEGTHARVDQIEPPLMVNPVAGFVMPDHLDESLEVFGVDGAPLGELLHESVSGGVMWEIAAGRAGPADAGPHHDITPAQAALANLAAGLVAADAAARGAAELAGNANKESALSALLRAIDTTLWSVDSFASLGSEHVAGLVGRPIAVVRAQLRLELMPPTDVDLSDPGHAGAWQDAQDRATRHAFPVRIGEITRSDDGVLGFFVDDDYAHFRLVDKSVAATATEAGRSRGQLGLLGSVEGMPADSAITHPYIAGKDEDDTLALHIGQTVTLTLLMHPSGKCHISSGLLPRKALALARDWVGPGLAKIAPSLRTGPVLVETDLDTEGQVRLPKVSVFGKNQNFLWRDTPATWRTDAILAATQSALLPDTPAEFREGWIRVAPDEPEAPATGGAGGTT